MCCYPRCTCCTQLQCRVSDRVRSTGNCMGRVQGMHTALPHHYRGTGRLTGCRETGVQFSAHRELVRP